MPEPSTDPVAAYLDEVREQVALAAPIAESPADACGPAYAALLRLGLTDSERLLAALDAVLALHVQATTWGAGLRNGRFDYCSTCSGHPAWPCPELQAISRALLAEGDTDAH